MAQNINGVSISIDLDTAKFKAGLTEVYEKIKLTKTEITNLKNVLKADPKNTVALEQLKEKLLQLKKELEETKQGLLDTFSDAQSKGIELTDDRMTALTQKIGVVSSELNRVDKQLDELNGTQGETVKGSDELNERLETAKGSWREFGATITKYVVQALKKVADYIKEVIEANIELDSIISNLNAIYNADIYNSTDIGKLESQITELSKTSYYSFEEIANGLTQMALAGYESEDAVKATQAALDLAAATGEDVESLASILVDTLHAFGASSDEAQRFADVMTTAANATNVSVADLGDSLKYAGPIAGQFGYSIEEIAGALAIMGQQGVKGSQAGTALRSMLSRLATDTSDARSTLEEYTGSILDSEGNLISLTEILSKMRDSLVGLSDTEQATILKTVAGQNALTGISAILNTSKDQWDSLALAIENADGKAERIAELRYDNLEGDLILLQNTTDALGRSFYEGIEPSLRSIIQQWTEFWNSPAVQEVAQKLGETLGVLAEHLYPILEDIVAIVVDLFGVVADIFKILEDTYILQAVLYIIWDFIDAIKILVNWVKQLFDWLSNLISKFKEWLGISDPQVYQGRDIRASVLKDIYSGGYGALQSGGFASGGLANVTINVTNNGRDIPVSTIRSWANIINEELGKQL